jgi:hypothetical protein
VVEKKVEEGEAAEKFIVTLSARVPTSWVDAKQTGMVDCDDCSPTPKFPLFRQFY